MIKLKKNYYPKIIFFMSCAILIAAFIIQYLLGYQPCNLCIIERIPYALAIIIVVLNYKFRNDQIFYSILLILVFLFSIIISVYHLGIEQDFIKESNVCGSNNLDLITKEEVLKSLQEIRISCKNVAFKFFGLSLTTYNILVSLLMFLISIKIYLMSHDIKK